MKRLSAFPAACLLATLCFLLVLPGFLGAEAGPSLPSLNEEGEPYRTPLAGEGFRTEVFGRKVKVNPQDRRSIAAWTLGLQINLPEPEDNLLIPFGSLYFWEHPDDDSLLRAEVVGLYNNIFYARSPEGLGPLEWVVAFRNFTLPFGQSELVDGELLESEKLKWGYVQPGFGLGYRRQVAPGREDNMFAVDLMIEPSYLYFSKSSDAAPNFTAPQDTIEVRGHLEIRWDALVRNILELPHRGFATGGDLVYGHRFDWESWGIDRMHAAGDERDFLYLTGYLLAAGGVPFVNSDRHRLIGSLHGGWGNDLDRFSAPRVGGGPKPLGEEYGSTSRPILPGSVIREFFPDHYAVLIGEYRWEPIFFAYLSLKASVAYLNRLRRTNGGIFWENDYLASLGGGVTTGFFFDSRLNFNYHYNTSVIRNNEYGGHSIVIRLSRRF